MTKDLQELIEVIDNGVFTEEEKIEQIQAILSENHELVNAKNRYGETPLSTAIKKGQLEIAKFLLEHGADVNLEYGTSLATPLHIAAFIGNEEMTKLLIDKGAKIDAVNFFSRSALYLAAEYGHEEIVELLIQEGKANINAIAGDMNITPLHQAVVSNHKEVAKVLIRHSADVHIQGGRKNNRLPLQLAAELGFKDMAKILIEQGKADVNLGDDDYGQKPLEIAIWCGHDDLAKMFLNYGTNIDDAENLYRFDMLSYAANKYGNQRIASIIPMIGFHYSKGPNGQNEKSVQEIRRDRNLGIYFMKGEQVRTHIRDNLPLLNGLLIVCREQNFNKLVQVEDRILTDGGLIINQEKVLAELKNLDKYLNENNFSFQTKNLLGSAAQKDYIAGVATSLMKGKEEQKCSVIRENSGEVVKENGAQNPAAPEQSVEADATIRSCFSAIRVKEHDKCVIL